MTTEESVALEHLIGQENENNQNFPRMNSDGPRHYPARICPDIRPDSWLDMRQWPNSQRGRSPLSIRPEIQPKVGRISLAELQPKAKFKSLSFSPAYPILYPARNWPDSWPDSWTVNFVKTFLSLFETGVRSKHIKHITQLIQNLIWIYIHEKVQLYNSKGYLNSHTSKFPSVRGATQN